MSGFNISQKEFDFARGFTIDFDLKTGFSNKKTTTKRYLSQMTEMFYDIDSAKNILKNDDPIIYEFHEMTPPQTAGDLAFGCSIIYPGKIGNEYYMTKGHFHTVLETAEIYHCLSGHGYILLENPEGDWSAHELSAGKTIYVPKRCAHRSINIDNKAPLVTYFVFRADAGHDYGTIESKGYRKLLVEIDNTPKVIDNPKWSVNICE